MTIDEIYDGITVEAQPNGYDGKMFKWLVTVSFDGRSAEFDYSTGMAHVWVYPHGQDRNPKPMLDFFNESKDTRPKKANWTAEDMMGHVWELGENSYTEAKNKKIMKTIHLQLTAEDFMASLLLDYDMLDYTPGEIQREFGWEFEQAVDTYNAIQESARKLQKLFGRNLIILLEGE